METRSVSEECAVLLPCLRGNFMVRGTTHRIGQVRVGYQPKNRSNFDPLKQTPLFVKIAKPQNHRHLRLLSPGVEPQVQSTNAYWRNRRKACFGNRTRADRRLLFRPSNRNFQIQCGEQFVGREYFGILIQWVGRPVQHQTQLPGRCTPMQWSRCQQSLSLIHI